MKIKNFYICVVLLFCTTIGYTQYSENGGTPPPCYGCIPLNTVSVQGTSQGPPNFGAINAAIDAQNAATQNNINNQIPPQQPIRVQEPTPPSLPVADPGTVCTLAVCVKNGVRGIVDPVNCVCIYPTKKWYYDGDGDGWNDKNKPPVDAEASPGSLYKDTTLGEDCDDGDLAVTNNCYKNYFIDKDGDGWDGGTISALDDNGGKYKLTTNGFDCDDDPATGGNVHKLNKCNKCAEEPVSGVCRDCITNNTNNPENIKPSEAKLSQNAINLLKAIETLRLVPYDDGTGKSITQYVKGATIGYGHLIPNATEFEIYKNGISESSASELFTNDINREIKNIRSLSYNLSQNQFDALAILVFNIGPKFKDSSLRKFLQNCNATTNYNSVEDAWKAFNKSDGGISQGLINRRICEWDIFVNGIYRRW